METSFQILFIASISFSTPILPMRHGNSQVGINRERLDANSDPTYEAWKPKGMININDPNGDHSDPTYEAWKLSKKIKDDRAEGHSDPTYEAWKLPVDKSTVNPFCHSDPTYEAWKPVGRIEILPSSRRTPILPMRHGNTKVTSWTSSPLSPDSDPTYEAWKQKGVI